MALRQAEGANFDLRQLRILSAGAPRVVYAVELLTDNTNAHGDGWNEEDLSIFSEDQRNDREDLHSGGGRCLPLCGPTPRGLQELPHS